MRVRWWLLHRGAQITAPVPVNTRWDRIPPSLSFTISVQNESPASASPQWLLAAPRPRLSVAPSATRVPVPAPAPVPVSPSLWASPACHLSRLARFERSRHRAARMKTQPAGGRGAARIVRGRPQPTRRERRCDHYVSQVMDRPRADRLAAGTAGGLLADCWRTGELAAGGLANC